MQSPLPHAKPDTSGQWKEYGDEGILFSMSCCLPSQTYLDCCGRNPCSSHQEHGICIKLRPKALPTRVLLHLRDLYSKKSKTKTTTKKTIQWPVSLSLPAQLNPKPRIVHEGKLTIKTLVWVCEHSRMGWNSLGGTAFLQEAQLFASVHISSALIFTALISTHPKKRTPPHCSSFPLITSISFKWSLLTHCWPRRS